MQEHDLKRRKSDNARTLSFKPQRTVHGMAVVCTTRHSADNLDS
jgi:hypothetical protein